MFLIWHLWLTTTNLSYRFYIFETSATASCGSTCISIVISRVFATQPLAAKVLTEEVPTETLEVAFVETITEAPGEVGGSWWTLEHFNKGYNSTYVWAPISYTCDYKLQPLSV